METYSGFGIAIDRHIFLWKHLIGGFSTILGSTIDEIFLRHFDLSNWEQMFQPALV